MTTYIREIKKSQIPSALDYMHKSDLEARHQPLIQEHSFLECDQDVNQSNPPELCLRSRDDEPTMNAVLLTVN